MAETEMTETEDYTKNVFPGLTITGDGVIKWQGASDASIYLFETMVLGDTNPRFRIRADGRIAPGPGNAPTDAAFTRLSAGVFGIYNSLWINFGYLSINEQQISSNTIRIRVTNDTVDRFIITGQGTFQWGTGLAAIDSIISRRAANILNTPDRFEVGTLGVANSASGNTPGNCQNKIEVFDAAGNSLGFIAVYDAIT